MNTEQSKYLKLNYAQYIQLTGIDKKITKNTMNN